MPEPLPRLHHTVGESVEAMHGRDVVRDEGLPDGLKSASHTEFINDYYASSEEPLNLRAIGQPWFERVFDAECASRGPCVSLVLGGTPWLGGLLRRKVEHVLLVDINPAMLDTAKSEIENHYLNGSGDVHYICADWLALPPFPLPIDVVTGDNCLNFLQYPHGWSHFFDRLMPQVSKSAQLVIRVVAIPPSHRVLSLAGIVQKYLDAESFGYTQVRAELLLSHWEPALKAINTEAVVRIFDAHQSVFEPLFRKYPTPHNDLVTIRKFRDSGFVLYAPPLDEVVAFLSKYFHVTGIHYGPFGLAEYFPIITARRH